jgi:SAM-dependent methyltransferase
MLPHINEFVSIVSKNIKIAGPIYEFGSYQVEGQEKNADLRPLFNEQKYVGCDIRNGNGVDLVLDIQDMALPSASVGTIIAMETLEHVQNPWLAAKEISRVLRKEDGVLIASTPMKCPIHNYPSDYWRFTPEGMKQLFDGIFEQIIIDYFGVSSFPDTVFILGLMNSSSLISQDKFLSERNEWRSKKIRNFDDFVKVVTPQILIPPLRSVWRSLKNK